MEGGGEMYVWGSHQWANSTFFVRWSASDHALGLIPTSIPNQSWAMPELICDQRYRTGSDTGMPMPE